MVLTLLCLAVAATALLAPAAQADFGIVPGSFKATAENEDGTVDFQAGSHPFQWKLSFAMNQDAEEEPEGQLRELFVDLPPGLVGNPTALPRCPAALFEGFKPQCPADTQIGIARVRFLASTKGTSTVAINPLYSTTPPYGVPASLGFSAANFNSFQEASLRSSSDYGISVADITVPAIKIQAVEETVWGVPAAHSHDAERGSECLNGEQPCRVASDAPLAPFFTLPTSCGAPLAVAVHVESLEEPGVPKTATAYSEEEGTKAGMDGCNAEEFKPQVTAKPTTNRADSPSGLHFDLHQPQSESCTEEEEGELDCGLSTAHLRDATVTLPEGLSLNPSAANGLGVCTEEEIGLLPGPGLHFSEDPNACPDASKVGTMTVRSPLLGEFNEEGKPTGKHLLHGAVYLAKPYQNPFGSLIAIYLVVEDPDTGIVVKLAGKVTPDPSTGRLTTTVTENPQQPLEDVELDFFKGARAPLKTPLACGTYTTTSTLTPWSSPEGQDVHPSDSFQTTQAAGAGSCPGSEAAAPNDPSVNAGTVSPQAGAFSPFVFKLARPDGSQPLRSIDIALPAGLTGRLAGVPYCPEAAIAQARSRERPNMGAVEQSDPSCPAATEVGTVTASAGAGPDPYYATGHAYLAGPYKGAPLSFAFVIPAVAGPFDLGAVVTRAAAYVDPNTAKITVRSDPIPQALQGIPLDVRSIAVHVDRPSFTLNPTSCEPMSLGVGVLSALGNTASVANRFQVGGCSALPYKPKLTTRIYGKTRRGAFPKLVAKVFAGAGEANSSQAGRNPAALRVPRTGPLRHDLHPRAVRGCGLPPQVGLRLGQRENAASGLPAGRPGLPALLKPQPARHGLRLKGTGLAADRADPGFPHRLQAQGHPLDLRRHPRRPLRRSDPDDAWRQAGALGQLHQRLREDQPLPGQGDRAERGARGAAPEAGQPAVREAGQEEARGAPRKEAAGPQAEGEPQVNSRSGPHPGASADSEAPQSIRTLANPSTLSSRPKCLSA